MCIVHDAEGNNIALCNTIFSGASHLPQYHYIVLHGQASVHIPGCYGV